MRAADPAAKALVFTQFNPTLEWLKVRFGLEGFKFCTISGSMPMAQRTKACPEHATLLKTYLET